MRVKGSFFRVSAYLAAFALALLTGLIPSAAQKENAPRQFSITIAGPTKASLSSETQVAVTLTNNSPQRMGFIDGGFGYAIDVRDARGNVVQATEKGEELSGRRGHVSGITRIKKLAPRETWVTHFPVNEWFDMSHPGEYTIRLSREKVQSNVLTVTVE